MSWFGLFDHLRLHGMSGAGQERHAGLAAQGWSMPGSQLRLTDRGLAALYRGAILAAGKDYRADMFDLAGHYLAHAAPAQPPRSPHHHHPRTQLGALDRHVRQLWRGRRASK